MANVQQPVSKAAEAIAENQRGKMTAEQKREILRFYASGLVLQLILAAVGVLVLIQGLSQARGREIAPITWLVPLGLMTPLIYSLVLLIIAMVSGRVASVEGTLSYETKRSRKYTFNYLVVMDDRGKKHKFHYNDSLNTTGKGKRVRVYYAWLVGLALNVYSAV